MLRFILTIAIPLFACLQPRAGLAEPKAVVLENSVHFGRVVRGTLVQHEFVVENRGSAPLVITRVTMTAPLTVQRLPRIEPGQRDSIPIKLDTSAVSGPFEGELVLSCNDPVTPEIHISFSFRLSHNSPLMDLSLDSGHDGGGRNSER